MFHTITEEDPSLARTYAEKPYTELFLLLEKYERDVNIDFISFYLQKLFTRYNSKILTSTLLKPDTSYIQESIVHS